MRCKAGVSRAGTVTTAGETVGELFFNNLSAYTLAGSGLTIDNSTAPALISVESGVHDIAAPLTLADDTTAVLSPATQAEYGARPGFDEEIRLGRNDGIKAFPGLFELGAIGFQIAQEIEPEFV